MKTSAIVTIVVVLAVILGGWYFLANRNTTTVSVGTSVQPTATLSPSVSVSVSPSPSASASPTKSPSPSPSTNSVLVLKSSSNASLGNILTASNGMTLYTSSNDSSGVSNCTGTCATNWPPYKVSSTAALVASTGISGKIGTITRADGTIQLTYKGMPLYFWAQDKKAGDTTGNNINSFVVAKP